MKNLYRGIITLLLLLASFSILSPAHAAATQPAHLTNISIASVPNHAQAYALILTFDQPLSHKAFTLTNPDRLVVDFPDCQFEIKTKAPDWTHSPIKDFRHGIRQATNLRLVFDLNQPLNFHSTSTSSGSEFQEMFILTSQEKSTENSSSVKSVAPDKTLDNSSSVSATTVTSSNSISPASKNLAVSGALSSSAQTHARHSAAHHVVAISQLDANIHDAVLSSMPGMETTDKKTTRSDASASIPSTPVMTAPISSDKKKSKTIEMHNGAISSQQAARNVIAHSASEAFLPTVTGYSAQRPFIVVIDAGHGGKDPGTTGPAGIHEKNVTLAIARDLYHLVKQQPGMKPVMTRSGDYYVGLRQRLAIARKAHGDVFVAIHADAYKDPAATGASVFALSQHGASSESALWLAQRENYSELGGIDLNGIQDQDAQLRSILIDLSQTAAISASLQLGNDVLKKLNLITNLHHNYVQQAPFMVLKSPDIPSILVETGFLSNPQEEARLSTTAYQKKIAEALFNGIKAYYTNYAARNMRLVRVQTIS